MVVIFFTGDTDGEVEALDTDTEDDLSPSLVDCLEKADAIRLWPMDMDRNESSDIVRKRLDPVCPWAGAASNVDLSSDVDSSEEEMDSGIVTDIDLTEGVDEAELDPFLEEGTEIENGLRLRSLLWPAPGTAVDSGVVCVAISCSIIMFPYVFRSPFGFLSASFACDVWKVGKDKWVIAVLMESNTG